MTDDELARLYEGHMRATPADGSAPDPDEIRRVARGEGTEAERLRVLDAVMQSGELRREFDMFRALAAGQMARRPEALRWVAFAAALLLAVFAGAQWWERSTAPDPWRGGDDGVLLVAPAEEADVAGSPVLTWRGVPGAYSYDVELLTDTGAVRHRASTSDTSVTIPAAALGQGRYRWTVTARLPDGTRRVSRAAAFSTRP